MRRRRGIRLRWLGCLALALWAAGAQAQLHTYVLGERAEPWSEGGGLVEPVRNTGTTFSARLDTGNVPKDDIEFVARPGWIGPRFFDGQTNIAGLVIDGPGRVRAPNSRNIPSALLKLQLEGIVNGDHDIAYERKPTTFQPEMPAFGIWIILDFGRQVGVNRLRFYPRNTVEATPQTPYEDDFLRGFELWINPEMTNSAEGLPDVLVARRPDNDDTVVEIDIDPRYVRLVKLRSLTETPFEIDELEVIGFGYMSRGTWISDLIDLGGRATVGPVRWRESVVGEEAFSNIQVRVRTGDDDTPLRFERRAAAEGPFDPDFLDVTEVDAETYWSLDIAERGEVVDDVDHWSAWQTVDNRGLIGGRLPRQFVQFEVGFAGRISDTRQLDWLLFDYLQPPIADTLRAEVFPRRAPVEQRATFRYAVQLRRNGAILGFDELEVDTTVPVENIRDVTVNDVPVSFEVAYLRHDAFRLRLPLIDGDGDILEFAFDMPVFRFGTTFSGRVVNSRFARVPQRLEAGNAIDFGPGDLADLSNLFVAIPEERIGKLVGTIVLSSEVITPNGDGINDDVLVQFNLLQLVDVAPVRFEIFDLASRRVANVDLGERSLGPADFRWDGTGSDGRLLTPGTYVWRLLVAADAFDEEHLGILVIAY